ncbi:DUF896 domain-containing protein [Mechercharimyces sp. CAU 1602]|uniref:DUF896 domain-containing protein n=1 Tax=Mechercharimyces sp. CAU 1602 TaxID=2973933 RepID=UPI002162B607|nr:DUF896 domain-containing protein [Mechercharimyces sp. CAU 1602]MCS1351112.1 DUF896 domain-containing protein [Mechercharimyces sp. CAU 1602]
MITKEMIERINTLAHKQKSEGLTSNEKEEQAHLRAQYLKTIRGRVKEQLSQVRKVDKQ